MTAAKVKRCPRCGHIKAVVEFYRRGGRQLSPYCRPCQRAAARLARTRGRQDPAGVEGLRAVDRARQRRHRSLGGQDPDGGAAA